MRLLIDGYNVLHQSGLLGKGSGGVWLERGRKKLLDLLRESLEPSALLATHIVFDAYSSSSISTEITSYQEIKVHFSLGYENADELIEKLIREHHAPKSLTVVSSDHRIQRCAKAHRCRIYDSSVWLDELPQRQTRKSDTSRNIETPREQATAQGLSNYEVQLWLKEFGITENAVTTFAEAATSSEMEHVVRSESTSFAVNQTTPSQTSSAKSAPRNTAKAKRESKPKTQIKPQNKPSRKSKQVELDSKPYKTSKAKLTKKSAEKKDMPRARKRAARPLPDGFKFPDADAEE
jgi:uncharacterized protein